MIPPKTTVLARALGGLCLVRPGRGFRFRRASDGNASATGAVVEIDGHEAVVPGDGRDAKGYPIGP